MTYWSHSLVPSALALPDKVPCVPVLPWDTSSGSWGTPWFMGQSWHHLYPFPKGQTGQGKLYTVTPPDCDCNLCSHQHRTEYFPFSPQALEGVREKKSALPAALAGASCTRDGETSGQGHDAKVSVCSSACPTPAFQEILQQERKKTKQNKKPT